MTFSGLGIALTSLQAQQRALQIASNNIANANTTGYSEEAPELTSLGSDVPAMFATSTGDGQGVQVASIQRFSDEFLQIQDALQHASLASLQQSNTTLQGVENVFGEPSDSGIASQLSSFWSAWDSVANDPGDPGTRSVLVQQATSVASTINAAASSLQTMQTSETSQLSTLVSQINSTAASLAQVNQSIKSGTISGLDVSQLEDQRDQLAGQLAQLTGATVQQGQFNQVTVSVGGSNLVFENQAQALSLNTSGPNAVLQTQSGAAVSVTSGQAGAMLSDLNTVLPGYMTSLNTVATTLRDQVNNVVNQISGTIPATATDQSAAGSLEFNVSLDGGSFTTVSVAGADWSGAGGAAALQSALQSGLDSAVGAGTATATVSANSDGSLSVSIAPTGTHTLQVEATGSNVGFATLLGTTPVGSDGVGGRDFFTGTDAASFAVSSAVVADPSTVTAGVVGNGPLDGSVGLQLADMATSTTGADASYNSMIVQLGANAQDVSNRTNLQQATTQTTDNALTSQDGVNTDEEMTNMVEYQKAYEASAQFVSTLNTMLDSLIQMVA
ncbi:MAG: flagellar hook-associated protein FlgK [Acidimicrobiia bacterium]